MNEAAEGKLINNTNCEVAPTITTTRVRQDTTTMGHTQKIADGQGRQMLEIIAG